MKECLTCFHCYEDDRIICPTDKSALQESLPDSPIIDDKYRLDLKLGEGGMGTVYRATHLRLKKQFAIKIIRRSHRNQEFEKRFLKEAEALARLKHINIVNVTDSGVDPRSGGMLYMVMEYLRGHTLAERIQKDGCFTFERALPILKSLADALDYAHSQRILHRDLKPANVFLTTEEAGQSETVKIVDFGLAKFVEASHRKAPVVILPGTAGSKIELPIRSEDSVDTLAPGIREEAVTEFGGVVGTFGYMSPEQFLGQPVSSQSDIYSFAVIAYEMFSGRRAFSPEKADTIESLLKNLQTIPVNPAVYNPTISAGAGEVILNAISADPQHRPVTGRDLVKRIVSAQYEARVQAWQARIKVQRWSWPLMLSLVMMVVFWMTHASWPVRWMEAQLGAFWISTLPQENPDPRLLILSIDESSLEADSTHLTQRADAVGEVIESLFQNGAGGVAIDLLLPAQWADSERFTDAIVRHSDSIALAAYSTKEQVIGPEATAGFVTVALGPQKTASLYGLANISPDPDGVVRHLRFSFRDRNKMQQPTFAARAAALIETRIQQQSERDAARWIDFRIDHTRYQRISWKDLSSELQNRSRLFEGKLVLIGAEYAASGDEMHRIPVAPGKSKQITGVILNALMINTIWNRFVIRPVQNVIPLAVFLCGILFAFAFLILRAADYKRILLIGCLAVIFSLCLTYILFRSSGTIIPALFPCLLFLLSASFVVLLRRYFIPSAPVFVE